MKIQISPEDVYYFVQNISHDKNPIHLKENPIIPGDLMSSLFIANGKYGKVEFKKKTEAPAELELKGNSLLYKDEEIASITSNNYKNIQGENLSYNIEGLDEIKKNLSYFFEKKGINAKNLELAALLNYMTPLITNYVTENFNVKLALYKSHSFGESNDNYFKVQVNEKKKGRYELTFELSQNGLYVAKELLISGKRK